MVKPEWCANWCENRRANRRADWRGFFVGVQALLPLWVGVLPFGVVYGAAAVSAGLGPWQAQAMSAVLFAGSAQFLFAQLWSVGTPPILILGAVLLINLRHLLYSASVAPYLAATPRRWKALLAYWLTDEAYAAAIPHLLAAPPGQGPWILAGSGFALWAGWQGATAVGVFLGQFLPTHLPLDFALTLTFIAIVVPMLRDRYQLAVALVAGGVATLLAGLPYKLGLFAGALAGMGVAALGLTWVRRRAARRG